MAARKYFGHVDAVEWQFEAGCDSFDGKAFSAAGNPHHQYPLRYKLSANAIAHQEQLATFQQPFFHHLQSADKFNIPAFGNILDRPRTIDQQTLFLE